MKKKHKITLLVIGILLALSLMLSSSYALWVFNVSQESTNVMVSDCFEITFTEGSSAIHLENAFPMKDSKGVYTTPYEFTLTNICEHAADVEINLETLNTSTLDPINIRTDLNGVRKNYVDSTVVDSILDNSNSAVTIRKDTIGANNSKNYNLRLWIKEDSNNEDVINKTFNSRITIRSTLRKKYTEAYIVDGKTFTRTIRSLAGDTASFYNKKNNDIKAIIRSNVKPSQDDNYAIISTENSPVPIYAWFDNGTIYIYSNSDVIYFNKDSSYMFYYYPELTDLDISYFDSSEVTNMSYMFYSLEKLSTLDISHLDTSKVTKMTLAFSNLKLITELNVSNFNTSNVTNMYGMLGNEEKIKTLDLSGFNTSKVTDMTMLFRNMTELEYIDVSGFDTSKVQKMSQMFRGTSSLSFVDLSNFDTSNVTEIDFFFEHSGIVNVDLSSFNISKVTNIYYMFAWCNKLEYLDLSSFDTSNVTNMIAMFRSDTNLKYLNLSSFDTSKVTEMENMFDGLSSLEELDISSFDTSNVTDMYDMFYGMTSVKKIYVSEKWSANNYPDNKKIFGANYKLVGGAGTKYDSNHTDKEYARIDDPANGKPGYFTYKSA